jgi:hypothetical protein
MPRHGVALRCWIATIDDIERCSLWLTSVRNLLVVEGVLTARFGAAALVMFVGDGKLAEFPGAADCVVGRCRAAS